MGQSAGPAAKDFEAAEFAKTGPRLGTGLLKSDHSTYQVACSGSLN